MYLKTDRIVATIGKVTMRSFRTSAPEYVLDPTALVGWGDGVDIRRNFTPRQIRAGDFLEAGRHASRYITFSGTAIARNAVELHQMRDDYVGMVLPKDYVPLSIQDVTGTRYSTVTIGGKTSWVQLTDTIATFKIDLYAPDPNIYGPSQTVTLSGHVGTGGITYDIGYPIDFGVTATQQVQFLSNNGNNEAWPTFTVTGDYFSGFSITDNLGNYITYTGPVTSKSPVTVDSLAGYAVQNNSDRSTYLSKRDWFSIPPQGSIQPSFLPNGTVYGWCDIIYRDTWI